LDPESIALLAYSLYIKEAMTALFKASNMTTVNLEEQGEVILEGAAMTVAFAKNILKVIKKFY
jgi:translation initiation factor 2 beta subunit (eIF-2beta)/eIF-5